MNIRGSKVLVTGGAGFIGSHIVDALMAKGAAVRIFDNFSSGRQENIAHHGDAVTVVRGDIQDHDALRRAMEGIDIVSHQAAQLEIFLATAAPERDLEINTLGTLNVLKAAREAGVKKVINASSACVYGQVAAASREEDPPVPNWFYGVSKLAAEKYAQIYNDYNALPVVSLRYGIVYGEREWYRRVLPIFLKRVMHGEAPVVFGDGSQVRDFVYVRDLVEFHNLCIEKSEADGQIFNVGTGRATTIVQLAQAAAALSETPLEVMYEDTQEGQFSRIITEKKRNSAELKTMLLDMGKAKRLMGWEPATPLAEGLRAELEWAREHPERWEKIKYTVV